MMPILLNDIKSLGRTLNYGIFVRVIDEIKGVVLNMNSINI